jgi:ribosomal protein S18 acetylase RimI-like enzyme
MERQTILLGAATAAIGQRCAGKLPSHDPHGQMGRRPWLRLGSRVTARSDSIMAPASGGQQVSTVSFVIRGFLESDADDVNRLAVAAFAEFRTAYSDWTAMVANLSKMSTLAAVGELIVAERTGRIIGAVTYVAPHRPKAAFFDGAWPIVRMLVVDPKCRGQGIGGALMLECVRRAKRDRAKVLALHSSPIMTAALALYHDMGFAHHRDGTPVFGVPTAVYVMQLQPCS